MSDTPNKIVLKDVHKRFGKKVVLDGLNLEVPRGKSLVVIGGSGTGKSVMLKCVLGLIKPDSGQILVDGQDATKFDTGERENMLHPTKKARVPRVTELLKRAKGPVIAVSDYVKLVPDQIARWVPNGLLPLGTDGFGRSDTRENLRRYFEVDAASIVVAALKRIAEEGKLDRAAVSRAIKELGIDPDKVDAAHFLPR